jgi:polyferredoxin
MELTRFPLVKSVLRSRWPQFILFALFLAGFLLAIAAGFVGTPVGSRNFGIVFTWIAWWGILILVAVPLFGRGWCAVCPIPLAGDWLQRGKLLGPGEGSKGISLNHRWPKRLRNIWMQNISFVLVALFSSVILTMPLVSGAVLVGMLFTAISLSMVFERRAFCRYLCPVSGFIGLYAQTAPVELRIVNKSVCVSCEGKPCYNGSQDGYGCPWGVFPGGLSKNTSCGLCMECLRTCPSDNISLRTRPFGADVIKPGGRRMDEAFKAFIMLGAAIIYAAVLLGPWGELKSAAYQIGTAAWFGYAAAFLLFIFIILPLLFLGAVKLGQRLSLSREPWRKAFTTHSYALVPLGLLAWVAFSLSFVFTNASYIGISLSDPFGWGWNLFGTAGLEWTPYLLDLLPFMQTGALILGLVWSVYTAAKLSTETRKGGSAALQTLPVASFSVLVTFALMYLLL